MPKFIKLKTYYTKKIFFLYFFVVFLENTWRKWKDRVVKTVTDITDWLDYDCSEQNLSYLTLACAFGPCGARRQFIVHSAKYMPGRISTHLICTHPICTHPTFKTVHRPERELGLSKNNIEKRFIQTLSSVKKLKVIFWFLWNLGMIKRRYTSK